MIERTLSFLDPPVQGAPAEREWQKADFEGKRFGCDTCKKSYATKQKLKQHKCKGDTAQQERYKA